MDRYIARANCNSNLSSNSASFTSRVSSQMISLPPKPPLIPSYQKEDTELGIFDAKHYYNEGNNMQNTLKRPVICDARKKSKESWRSRSRSFHTAPTSSTEASWNSRSGLLSNPPGSAAVHITSSAVNRKSKPGGRNFFSRNCPCYGKKSVDVEEKRSSPVPFSMRKEHPMISNSVMIPAGLRWPEFTFPMPAQTKSRDDDVASDTSSDLFEIESFAANSMYQRRDSLDEYLKLGQSKCYAPSEVSVEWSVTTTEPSFDCVSVGKFSSAASDYEEKRVTRIKHKPSLDREKC